MDEELEKLQSLGAQKIYEETHIPLKYVQSMLHGSFEGFSRVQFLGFISILEREYNLNLNGLKGNGLKYFDEVEQKTSAGVFIVPKKKQYSKLLYLGLIIFLFAIVVLFSLSKFSQNDVEVEVIENTHIETIQKKIESLEAEKEDINVSDSNLSDVNSSISVPISIEETPEPIGEIVEKSLEITSKGNVWFGYIDAKTNKHFQGKFKGKKELDPEKDWLLLFGHGFIDIYVNGEVQKFKSRENVRFLYKDNKLEAISLKEFKRFNRGRKW